MKKTGFCKTLSYVCHETQKQDSSIPQTLLLLIW